MSTLTHHINKKIHFLRVKFGCSQEMMGHIIGVTGRTIARWELVGQAESSRIAERLRQDGGDNKTGKRDRVDEYPERGFGG